ncbi:MAG: hypothetical protein QG646_1825 [Euryarchaeota archaeon]|nr:hypothetical protein [Euryarchaeota archaeon]
MVHLFWYNKTATSPRFPSSEKTITTLYFTTLYLKWEMAQTKPEACEAAGAEVLSPV